MRNAAVLHGRYRSSVKKASLVEFQKLQHYAVERGIGKVGAGIVIRDFMDHIVDAINSTSKDLSSCGHIISDIKLSLLSFDYWSLTQVKKVANQVAHYLAKGALCLQEDVVVIKEIPLNIHPYVTVDVSI
ncbi:hypothetical protein I3843_15G122600 [Carya illinoinensis]|nr:hypothetical protein I3843_15G122600 [Carya illinoinensis]